MTPTDITQYFTQFFVMDFGHLVLKILLLVLLFIYLLFTFIVANRIRAFNRIVHIGSAHASSVLQLLAVVQFVLTLVLFFLAIIVL